MSKIEALRATQIELGPIKGFEVKKHGGVKGNNGEKMTAVRLPSESVQVSLNQRDHTTQVSGALALDGITVFTSFRTEQSPKAKLNTTDYTNWEKPKCCGNG